ncbi:MULTISPECIES: hypothetical protein [unclassified Bartonella]|uniref:hypothetical protein n=1 Tax=unclassified Bartonella TaxID=2645622 RepID=UPI0035D01FAA
MQCMCKISQNGNVKSNVEGVPFLGKTVQQLRVDLGEKAFIFKTDRNIDDNN